MNIEPLGDRVLLKEIQENAEKKTKSGIILPASTKENTGTKKGKVVAVGEGHFEDGKKVPVSVKKNDVVLFQWGDKIVIDDEEYYIIRESEIIAKILK